MFFLRMFKHTAQSDANVHSSLEAFCKKLPGHVQKWKDLLAESEPPLRGLINLAEQLRHVEKYVRLTISIFSVFFFYFTNGDY